MNNVKKYRVDISICLCTFNRADQLQNALNSLITQRTEGVFTYEIVVVDDGSCDTTDDVVRQARTASPVPVHYIWQSNAGIGTARNRSVKEASGDWIAFFDDDQIASPEWLLRLYREALRSRAECVGGPVRIKVPEDCQVQPFGIVRKLLGENSLMASRTTWFSRFDPRRAAMAKLAIPGTGNALIRKDVFLRMGGFRNGLRYGEDFDFFLRVSQAGIKTRVAPSAVVEHLIPESRLRPEYLTHLASMSAHDHADHNWKDHNLSRLLFIVTLRVLHLAFWTIPMLQIARLFRQRDLLLAKKCSLHFAVRYFQEIAAHFTSRITDAS